MTHTVVAARLECVSSRFMQPTISCTRHSGRTRGVRLRAMRMLACSTQPRAPKRGTAREGQGASGGKGYAQPSGPYAMLSTPICEGEPVGVGHCGPRTRAARPPRAAAARARARAPAAGRPAARSRARAAPRPARPARPARTAARPPPARPRGAARPRPHPGRTARAGSRAGPRAGPAAAAGRPASGAAPGSCLRWRPREPRQARRQCPVRDGVGLAPGVRRGAGVLSAPASRHPQRRARRACSACADKGPRMLPQHENDGQDCLHIFKSMTRVRSQREAGAPLAAGRAARARPGPAASGAWSGKAGGGPLRAVPAC